MHGILVDVLDVHPDLTIVGASMLQYYTQNCCSQASMTGLPLELLDVVAPLKWLRATVEFGWCPKCSEPPKESMVQRTMLAAKVDRCLHLDDVTC